MSEAESFSGLDWAQIRARLERLQAESAGRQLDPGQAELLLRQRALALAPAPAAARDAGEETVVFRVAESRYGIASRRVREVVQLAGWSSLPGARAPLLGVAGWRGELLTLLDIAAALGHPSTPAAAIWVLVLQQGDGLFGVPVAEVEGMQWLHADQIRAAGADNDRVRGLTADGVAVLDDSWLDHLSRTTP